LVNAADTLAAAAALMMGEGAEQSPLALIEDAPVKFRARAAKLTRAEIKYPLKDDLYYPFLKKFGIIP
jgi:F420-0:gamma-glutamyl ligase